MPSLTQRLQSADAGRMLEAALRHAPAWVCALLVVVVAWQLAGMTWLVAAGPAADGAAPIVPVRPQGGEAVRGSSVDVQRILDAHLFGQANQTPVAAAPVEMPETRLNLRLRGVIANDDPSTGIAIIADDRGQERLYRVDQTLPGNVRLQAVYADQVVLNRNGTLETLRLPRELPAGTETAARAPAPAVAQPAPSFQPRGAEPASAPTVQDLVADSANFADRITDYIRIQPYVEGGTLRGYRLVPGRDEQLFAELGLQPGDLVTAIEGTPLTDPARGLEAFAALGNATRVNITVERNGVQQTMMLDTETISRIAGAALR